MSCTNCQPPIPPIVVTSSAQQPFCDPCSEENGCAEKMDAACVVYHLDNPQKTPHLDSLGLGNGATVEQIAEAINGLVVNNMNIPLTVTDTPTVDLTNSGAAGHTLKADVKVSAQAGNIITAKADGLHAAAYTLTARAIIDLIKNDTEFRTLVCEILTECLGNCPGVVQIN